MKKCGSKIKHTCGSTNWSTCINYEGSVNAQSDLATTEECLNLSDTTEDIYSQLESILNESELTALGTCPTIEYVTVEGKIFVKNALLALEAKICELESRVEELETTDICNKSLSSCDLDFGCLVLPCGDIDTVGDLFQALINKACE